MPPRPSLLLALLPIVGSLHAADITEARRITAFESDLPASLDQATLSLRFVDCRPLRGDARGSVIVQIQRRDGAWAAEGHYAAADYNQRSRERKVTVGDLTFDGQTVKGTLEVMIGPDSPRPRDPGFPNPADEFTFEFAATLGAETDLLPYQPDTMASMAPWRKDVPRYGGHMLRGSYTARRGGTSTEGVVEGALNHAPVPGRWGASGNAVLRPVPGGGLHLLARLSPHRVADGHQAWAELRFPEPQDWSAWTGLVITLGAHARREDVGVALSIKEKDGVWYSVHDAAPLPGREGTFRVPFDRFRGGTGGTYTLDVKAIETLQVGVDNPHGVGDVEFAVREIGLYRAGAPYGQAPEGRVEIKVDPSTVVARNGHDTIPKGLFGFHDVGENSPRATRDGEPDPFDYIRALNPGSLRPLTHVGFGGRRVGAEEAQERIEQRLAASKEPEGVFYRRARAGNAVDEVIWTHTMDLWNRPVWMDEGVEATAEKVRSFYTQVGANAWVPGDDHNLLRRLEVWNEPFMWGRHFHLRHLAPPGRRDWEDPTQYGYIPGRVGSEAWATIFLAAVEGAKSVNPHVLMGGPSAPAFNSDDYGVLEHHVIPILDRVAPQLDFVTEHHYGGYRKAFAASYEVVTAYLDTRHHRRPPIYNTETNDLSGSSLDKAHYNIEDILACIQTGPDKVKGRALHAMWNGYLRDPGEEHAYRILSTLRGRILAVDTSDPDIMAVASSPGEGRMVVFLFNASRFPREVSLDLGSGPWQTREAWRLTGETTEAGDAAGDTEGADVRRGSGRTRLEAIEVQAPETAPLFVSLPSRSALRLDLAREGYAPTRIRNIEQHFADLVVARVTPSTPARGRIVWRGEGADGATRATLRVVTAGVMPGEAVAVIHGREIPLPMSSGNGGEAAEVQEIPLDPAILAGDGQIEFRVVRPEQGHRFTVYMASVDVER